MVVLTENLMVAQMVYWKAYLWADHLALSLVERLVLYLAVLMVLMTADYLVCWMADLRVVMWETLLVLSMDREWAML